MRITAGVFWGLLLVLTGIAMIFSIFLSISLLRVLFSLFLILIGISILFGKKGIFTKRPSHHDNIFNDRIIRDFPSDQREYNVIFGKTTYDYRNFSLNQGKTIRIKLNTVFGSSEIMINGSLPLKIKIDSAFSEVSLPDNTSSVFGPAYYTSPAYNETLPYLFIEANVVFGSLKVKSHRN